MIIRTLFSLFLFFAIGPNLAWSAPQCNKLFEPSVLTDKIRANTNNDAGLFVAIINNFTKNLQPIPFGEAYPNSISNSPYTQGVQTATRILQEKGLSFADIADRQFILSETGSTALRQKIRTFVQNTYAINRAMNGSGLNFRFFAQLVKLGGFSESESKMILQDILSEKFKSIEIRRVEVLIPLIIEQTLNPDTKPFIKVVQDSEDRMIAVTNSRSVKLNPIDVDGQFSDLGIDFYEIYMYRENNSHQFVQENSEYTLSFSYKKGKVFDLLRPKEKPKLAEMWKDKQLQGTILIDKEFTHEGSWLVDEYKDYYRSQGFEFSRVRSMSIDDAFINPFVNGELDYLVTEHSGEVSLQQKVQVLIGTRQTAKGLESVKIIYTNEKYNETPKNIRYAFETENELPRLIRLRNANKVKTELIYVNGQCYTANELQNIINNVDSPHFTYIAPANIAETFTSDDTSPLRALITGIRKGTPYRELQKNIRLVQKQNEDENENQVNTGDNDFRLPHLPATQRNKSAVREPNRRKYKVQLLDSANKNLPIEFVPLHEDEP